MRRLVPLLAAALLTGPAWASEPRVVKRVDDWAKWVQRDKGRDERTVWVTNATEALAIGVQCESDGYWYPWIRPGESASVLEEVSERTRVQASLDGKEAVDLYWPVSGDGRWAIAPHADYAVVDLLRGMLEGEQLRVTVRTSSTSVTADFSLSGLRNLMDSTRRCSIAEGRNGVAEVVGQFGDWVKHTRADEARERTIVWIANRTSSMILGVECSRGKRWYPYIRVEEPFAAPRGRWTTTTLQFDGGEAFSLEWSLSRDRTLARKSSSTVSTMDLLKRMGGGDVLRLEVSLGTGKELAEQFSLAGLSEALDSEPSCRTDGPALAGHDGVTYPKQIEGSRLSYPARARRAGVQATVRLEVVVRSDGTVGDVIPVECDRPGFGFEDAAIDSVRQSRFEPGRYNGEPVDAIVFKLVEFELRSPPRR